MKAFDDEAHKIFAAKGRQIDLAVAGNKTSKLWKVFGALPVRHREQKNGLKDFVLAFADKFELDLSGRALRTCLPIPRHPAAHARQTA